MKLSFKSLSCIETTQCSICQYLPLKLKVGLDNSIRTVITLCSRHGES